MAKVAISQMLNRVRIDECPFIQSIVLAEQEDCFP
jgi:hypothetical protein